MSDLRFPLACLLVAGTFLALTMAAPVARADVLVAGSPGDPTWLTDIQTKIQGTGLVTGNVDTFNTGTGTPTLAQLQTYAGVLVFTDGGAQNPTLLGDNLADYVDAGGGVVQCTFSWHSSIPVGGRWQTGGYSPLNYLAQTQGTLQSLGVIALPGHAVMNGIASFNGGSASYRNTGTLAPSATLIASWTDGLPLIVEMTGMSGGIIGLNFYPPSSTVRVDFWDATTDGATFMGNALVYVGPQGPEMDVQRPAGTSIADGGSDALGNVAFGAPLTYTYTIENTGSLDLNLTGTPLVSATANTNCAVNVTTQPTTPVTASGGTTTFVVDVTVSAIGVFDFDISIDNDDANENPYDFNVRGTGISAAEMDVQRPTGTTIADGGNDALGNVPITIVTPYIYTIQNIGSDVLNLTGTPLVSATANTNCTVNVTTQPTTPVAQGGGTTTFVVELTVTALGAFDFDISIDNDDADENPYNFNVAGTGVLAPEIDVQRPAGTSIPSGGNDNVGNLATTTPTDITYTIANTGVNTLNLLGTPPDYVTLSGEVNCTAIVFTQPTTPVAPAGTTTFIVRIQPSAAGACAVVVTILNDDTDESTYTFTITGNGVTSIGGGGGGCCRTTSDPAARPGNTFLILLAAVLLLIVPVIRRRM